MFVVTASAERALAQKSPSPRSAAAASSQPGAMRALVTPAAAPAAVTPVNAVPAVVTPVAPTPVAPTPAAVAPAPEARSTVGDLRVAISGGVGTLSRSETYYDPNTGLEKVRVVAGVGAASLYVGWGVYGQEGAPLTIELGYRLAIAADDTAAVHAHEFTALARMRWVFTSLGLGFAGLTAWDSPGFSAPRVSFSAQFGFNVFDELFIAFDAGFMMGPDDDTVLERYALTVGYTF
jgi:hypothetical protein